MKKTAKNNASSNKKFSSPSFSIVVLLALCSIAYYFLDDQFYDAASLTIIFMILFGQLVFFTFDAIRLKNPINLGWACPILSIAFVLFGASRNLNQINQGSSFVCLSLMGDVTKRHLFQINENEFYIEPIRSDASTNSFVVTRGALSIYFAAREVSSNNYKVWYSQFANLKNIKNYSIINCGF